jgi:hypothetical protein
LLLTPVKAVRKIAAMKITLSLDPDRAAAFASSLEHFLGDVPAEGFLERCVDNLIEAAAKGEFLVSPNFLNTVEG